MCLKIFCLCKVCAKFHVWCSAAMSNVMHFSTLYSTVVNTVKLTPVQGKRRNGLASGDRITTDDRGPTCGLLLVSHLISPHISSANIWPTSNLTIAISSHLITPHIVH